MKQKSPMKDKATETEEESLELDEESTGDPSDIDAEEDPESVLD